MYNIRVIRNNKKYIIYLLYIFSKNIESHYINLYSKYFLFYKKFKREGTCLKSQRAMALDPSVPNSIPILY